jgi:Peptidase family M28
MATRGWKQLVEGWPWFRGEGSFPLLPNSEYMQPVRLVRKPYGSADATPIANDDPYGWPITEYAEALMLRPGLRDLLRHLLAKLVPLCRQDQAHDISEFKLCNNPYWPADLAARSKTLTHERFVLLLPLALSITQDDKAHSLWTLFGNSEQSPAHAFWKGFFTAPGKEVAADIGLGFFRALLAKAYGEPRDGLTDLKKTGFRILHSLGPDATLPSWTGEFLWTDGEPLPGVKYLLTFHPFRDLPTAVRKKYLAGDLNLLPFPGSLLFWGIGAYQKLGRHLRYVEQTPLLHFVERVEHKGGRDGLRIPQSGWFHEDGPNAFAHDHGHGPFRETYKRPYRQARAHRFEDHLVYAREHRLPHTLFSTKPHDIDLYYKPMARNVQLWTHDMQPLLDGPTAHFEDIHHAAAVVADGGLFGYRFFFPPMHVGKHEIFWHRPLVGYLDSRDRAVLLEDAPLGYLTAYDPASGNMDRPIELWPRVLRREAHVANVECFQHLVEMPPHITMTNVMKLLDAWERGGKNPLPRALARRLLTIPKRATLESWLRGLPSLAKPRHRERASWLVEHLQGLLEPPARVKKATAKAPPSLTYKQTATRAFEENYWNLIARLAIGDYVNKNNADCVRDQHTQCLLKHTGRDLEKMGDYILEYYGKLIAAKGMSGAVEFGELPFRWTTDYHFPWMGGWARNQDGEAHERNLLVKIPGRDRSRAVVMADHYDTAYMHDIYYCSEGGTGARLSAKGADDNCSATAALMLGADPFLELSKAGKLDCDIWLLHLTGEEYPAEGLGTCRMCQWLVEGTLALHTPGGARHDLSGVTIQGVYVLDMIAHNVNKTGDIFQIAPGASAQCVWLAHQAHLANQAWNDGTEVWNRQLARRRAARAKRSRDGVKMPAVARHLPLQGEIRPHYDPRSTLFNTDGQAFSDFGIPVVLFMEDYDINRLGYHDMHDNMTLIDLDYGSALAAITIETVARAATEKPPGR